MCQLEPKQHLEKAPKNERAAMIGLPLTNARSFLSELVMDRPTDRYENGTPSVLQRPSEIACTRTSSCGVQRSGKGFKAGLCDMSVRGKEGMRASEASEGPSERERQKVSSNRVRRRKNFCTKLVVRNVRS